MKINIVIDHELSEDSITIHCRQPSETIQQIQNYITNLHSTPDTLIVYEKERELYLKVEDIIFFQSEGRSNFAHTTSGAYVIKQKLYELEELLSDQFIRISKSAIINIGKIHGISHGFTMFGEIEFEGTHKQVSISRSYYKDFKIQFKEKRKLYETK